MEIYLLAPVVDERHDDAVNDNDYNNEDYFVGHLSEVFFFFFS